jgi:hypothetical protein
MSDHIKAVIGGLVSVGVGILLWFTSYIIPNYAHFLLGSILLFSAWFIGYCFTRAYYASNYQR